LDNRSVDIQSFYKTTVFTRRLPNKQHWLPRFKRPSWPNNKQSSPTRRSLNIALVVVFKHGLSHFSIH
jgi:hypothetical protein